jgi:hypothetical protein
MKGQIQTQITRDYGVRHPIALAPMASLPQRQTLRLRYGKRADSGSLAVGPRPAEAVRTLIQDVRGASRGPLNVNFITFLAARARSRRVSTNT